MEYVDIRIEADPSEKLDSTYKQNWFEKKEAVGAVCRFPNLPYYLAPGVALSQSNTSS